MLLGSFEFGIDIPLFGHISIFDPNSLFGDLGFLIGAFIAMIIMYAMINKQVFKKRRGGSR